MTSFDYIWQLLAPQGEYCRRMAACRLIWEGYDTEKQRQIYATIKGKLQAGEFVNENPYFAIVDNAYTPRKQKQTLSYREYYARYGTTEELDGWRMVKPQHGNVYYEKK